MNTRKNFMKINFKIGLVQNVCTQTPMANWNMSCHDKQQMTVFRFALNSLLHRNLDGVPIYSTPHFTPLHPTNEYLCKSSPFWSTYTFKSYLTKTATKYHFRCINHFKFSLLFLCSWFVGPKFGYSWSKFLLLIRERKNKLKK